MGMKKNKNQLLMIALAVGFLIGILYENLGVKEQGSAGQIFEKSYLQQYLQMKVVARTYLWYVVKERLKALVLLTVLSFFRWRRGCVYFLLAFLGFFFGIISVSSVLMLGMGGLMLCVGGLFPHGIFYGASLTVLFHHWSQTSHRTWNQTQMLFVCIGVVVGLISEVYLNPWIMKWLIPIVLH